MPSGKTHDKISIIGIPVILSVPILINLDYFLIIILLISYLFASFMFNGDLDIVSKPYNRWGFLKFIWIPYQNIFTHISVFTHGIIFGTVVRLLYLGSIIFLILYFNNINPLDYVKMNTIIVFVVGLELGSAIHTISDYIL